MQQGWGVGVVIPARNEELHIAGVLETLPPFVDLAVVINDGSTDATEQYAREALSSANVIILNTGGIGVGGAIDAGHQYLLNQLDWQDTVGPSATSPLNPSIETRHPQ